MPNERKIQSSDQTLCLNLQDTNVQLKLYNALVRNLDARSVPGENVITGPDTNNRGGDVPDEGEDGNHNRLLVGARLPCISKPLQPKSACMP
jgi:hypothetical protein